MAAVCQPRRALAEIPAPQPKIAGEFLAFHLTCVTCCLERGATLLELSRRSRPLHVDNSAKFEKKKQKKQLKVFLVVSYHAVSVKLC